jgi:hypothetical protein
MPKMGKVHGETAKNAFNQWLAHFRYIPVTTVKLTNYVYYKPVASLESINPADWPRGYKTLV